MKMLDLFSGIGGFSLAARWVGGIDTVGFCEIDPYCQKILKKNFPDVPIFKDIRNLQGGDDINGTVDIITGGFPCQPFSIAGQKRGKKDDRDLWPQMFRVIQEFKPTWVIGENVANFVNMEFQRTKIDLESEGYQVQPYVIPACSVGAPHRRDRVWIVAYADSNREVGNQPENGEGCRIKSRCEDVPPSDEKRKRGLPKRTETKYPSTGIGGNDAPNPQGFGQPRGEISDHTRHKPKDKQSGDQGRGEVEQHLRQWEFEPNVGRVANGVPRRVDRLKSLGNSIVPQVFYQILKAIKGAA